MNDPLVRELRKIRRLSSISISASRINYNKKAKLKAKSKFRCTYCKGKFNENELYITKKFFTPKRNGEYGRDNDIVVCEKCKADKERTRLDHREFIRYLYNERQEKRKKIYNDKEDIKQKVFKKYNYECIYCLFEFGHTPEERKERLQLEHKKSLFRRGENEEKNFCPACDIHNREKGPLTTEEYFNFLEKNGRKYKAKKPAF